MPLKYIKPDEFFSYNGIIIYNVYSHDNYSDPCEYWFTTDVNEDSSFEFDVRDIPTADIIKVDGPKAVLKYAIENKLLKLPEDIDYTR